MAAGRPLFGVRGVSASTSTFVPASARLVHLREWLVLNMDDLESKHRESEWWQGQMDGLRHFLIELDDTCKPEWTSYLKFGEE